MDSLPDFERELQEDAKKTAGKIADYVNSFSRKESYFCSAMSLEHRTLQQSFTRLCFLWIEYCASNSYHYDGRNEHTHLICKQLVELWKEKNQLELSNNLPLI